MCDLHKPDGLLACYAFATWNKTERLAVNAATITGQDVIDRYAGDMAGYPTLLVYDGEGKAMCEYHNKNIPSEVDCKTIMDSKLLKFLFVPAIQVEQTGVKLDQLNLSSRVWPLELFELQEIDSQDS